MPRQAAPGEVHQQVPPEYLAGPAPARDYGSAGWLVRVTGGLAPWAQEPTMDEAPELPLRAAQGEVLVEHPEVKGAILRLPTAAYNPKVHKLWDLDVAPWRDGAGNQLRGATVTETPAPKPRRKTKVEAEGE